MQVKSRDLLGFCFKLTILCSEKAPLFYSLAYNQLHINVKATSYKYFHAHTIYDEIWNNFYVYEGQKLPQNSDNKPWAYICSKDCFAGFQISDFLLFCTIYTYLDNPGIIITIH